jgi:hypothetical protein
METYTVPRGIKIRETVAYGLNGKQIIYLAFGIGGALGICALPLPFDLKIAGSILSSIASLFLSLAKRHGQELDKYVWNTVQYSVRNKELKNDVEEKPVHTIKINYGTRQPSTA